MIYMDVILEWSQATEGGYSIGYVVKCEQSNEEGPTLIVSRAILQAALC